MTVHDDLVAHLYLAVVHDSVAHVLVQNIAVGGLGDTADLFTVQFHDTAGAAQVLAVDVDILFLGSPAQQGALGAFLLDLQKRFLAQEFLIPLDAPVQTDFQGVIPSAGRTWCRSPFPQAESKP